MARVRLNEPADVIESHRWLAERLAARDGYLNIFRAMSHAPEAMLRFMRFGSHLLEDGKLDPALRELAILRTGWLTRSPYEFSQHIAFGRRAGLNDEQIRAIAEPDAPGAPFDDRQRAVIAYAGSLTSGASVSDDVFEAVGYFLDGEQLVELTMVVGFYNMVARILNALDVDLDEPAARDLAALGVDPRR